MSDIRFNQWLHQSGTGGVSQSDGGHVGIGTTNPLIPVGAGNTHILNVGVVTCNNISAGSSITATTFYGSGSQLTGITSPAITSIASDGAARVLTSDGDGTATAHSFVTIESNRLSVNRGSGSGAFPLIVRRTDASGIIAEFANSSGYGLLIGQNSATGEAYLRTGTGQPLVFTTNSGSGIANERVRIDSSGRIGIGENNPTRDIVIKKSGSVQVSMVGATNQNIFLNFGDTDDDNIGGVIYDNGNNRMIIRANTNDAVQVKSNGNMAINDGDLEIGTSGHGISFAATGGPSNGTGSSELFDDYEEGTWIPGMAFGGGTSGISYSSRSGSYVKIGRYVYCVGQLDLSNRGSSGGDATFTNLPFTAGNYVSGSSHEGSGQITWWHNTNTTDNWSFWISENSTNATIYGTFGNGSGSVATTTHGHYNNNSQFRFHLSYMAQ